MFICGGPLSAHGARPPKIRGWIVVVRENFSVNKSFVENKQLKLYKGFLSVFFSHFIFGFHGFGLKIFKII